MRHICSVGNNSDAQFMLVRDARSSSAHSRSVSMQNQANEPAFRWQYFASYTGAMRVFPGREWPTDSSGAPASFDARLQPWCAAVFLSFSAARIVVLFLFVGAWIALVLLYSIGGVQLQR